MKAFVVEKYGQVGGSKFLRKITLLK